MTSAPSDGRKRPASLARRLAPAAVLGSASVVFVLALDRPTPTEDLATGTDELPAATLDGATTPSTSAPSTSAPSTTAPSTTTTTSGGRTSPSTTAPSTTSPSTTVPATPTCTGDEVTGPSVNTRFGPVQVAATIADDGTICAVDTLQYPDNDRKSLSINQRAVPTLEQRTLQAQSAKINAVSGATITSRAYVQSLQAILDG